MATLQELEQKINKYMLLADKGIIKLLVAFVIGNKLPLPPPWLFIVTSSSGGKTKLIQLLESVPGYFDIDDLTGNTLLSGVKNHEKPTSLLHKVSANGFLVFRDFTTILSKNKEVMGTLMGQLRMVYDGKFVKHTGLGDEIAYKPKKAPGLLAGVTTKIYTTAAEWADMGERMVMYHLEQPDNRELGMWILNDEQEEKQVEEEIRQMFAEYIESIDVPQQRSELPRMDDETKIDLVDIATLAVRARSPVERAKWTEAMILRHDQEMIGRMLKQLRTLAFALMLINGGSLKNEDKSILYNIALDSIPIQRRSVLKVLTKNIYGGDVNQIAEQLDYPYDTVNRWVEDLKAVGLLEMQNTYIGSGTRKKYVIKPEWKEIIAKFENIIPEETELPELESNPNDPFNQ